MEVLGFILVSCIMKLLPDYNVLPRLHCFFYRFTSYQFRAETKKILVSLLYFVIECFDK